MNKIDEQLKREMPFDLYGRYAIIRNIINNNRKEGEKFRVLDVGGRGNFLKKFLPEDEVFYLDPLLDSADENFIKGDGCAMPLKDEEFDWATSADVFEHIPKEKRNLFLEENIRVSRSGVILAAPFWSEAVERAEFNANENYKNFSGGIDHQWLKEHIENGLPKERDLEDFLSNKKLDFQKLYNNRLFLWETIIGINFFVWNNFEEDIKKALEEFNFFYNSEVFPHDSAEPSYRKVYFIKKDLSLKDIKKESKLIDDMLFLDVIKKAIDLVAKIDNENKPALQLKDQEIEALKQAIQQKDQKIKDRNQEIKTMKSSKFWKMREQYLSLKNKFSKK